MKKIVFFTFISISFAYSQNYSETVLDGSKPVLRVNGTGTVSGFIQKAAIVANTGNVSTANENMAIIGISSNSTAKNYGVYGYANGLTSLENTGLIGNANVAIGRGVGVTGASFSNSISADFLYGGNFITNTNTGINGAAQSYAVYAKANGTGEIDQSYGVYSVNFTKTTNGAYGVFATSLTSGSGNEYGGFFEAGGSSTGLKVGLFSRTSGITSVTYRYGLQTYANGPSTTLSAGTYSIADNSGNGQTYGGYFEAKGSGIGSKFGLYATTSGSGNQYAAALIGKVGINTEVPAEQLTIYTTPFNYGFSHTNGTIKMSSYIDNTAGWFGTKSAHPLYFYTNDGQQPNMTILTNGNVGVGTTAPTEKLQVNGNIKSTGNLDVNVIDATNITASGNVNGNYGVFSSNVVIGNNLNTAGLIVGSGGVITKISKVYLPSENISAIGSNSCVFNDYTVNGVLPGDIVILNVDADLTRPIVSNVRVFANNTVRVKFCNTDVTNSGALTGIPMRFIYYR